jgi:hypothetical protein
MAILVSIGRNKSSIPTLRLFGVIAMFVLWNAASAQTPLPAPSQHAASSSPKASQAGSRLEPPPTAMPFVHDPSTVLQYHGKYYVYTSGPCNDP